MPAKYGGVERHVHDLSISLAQKGYDITVYSRKWYTQKRDGEYGDVKILHKPTLKTKHLDAITHTLISTLHAIFQKYDVIHYHGVGPSLVSWIPRIFSPRTKVITTFHSIDRYHQKWGGLAKFFLRIGEWTACRFAHETITVSESLKQYCLNEFGKETNYIPNGVNISKNLSLKNLLSEFGLEKNKYLVMVSRLVPHKGAHLLIEAFHNLKAHNPDDPTVQNLKLAIVGGEVYTSEYVRQLHMQASNVNDIVFTDFQSGEILEQLYTEALALVHPSLNEGLPITVLQAMSYGKPALLSTIPEHLELVSDPRMLYKENDVRQLESCISEFLNLNSGEKEKIGEENLKLIEKKYTWDVVVPQIEKVYKQDIGSVKTIKLREVAV